MRRFKGLLIVGLMSLGFDSLQGQPASPEQINQAVELLRKTRVAPGTPSAATNAQPADLPAPDNATALTTEQEKNARELLRKTRVPTQPALTPQAESVARWEAEKRALAEALRSADQSRVAPGKSQAESLAQEQALKAQVEAARAKEIARIEAEVARARELRRQREAAASVQVSPTPSTIPPPAAPAQAISPPPPVVVQAAPPAAATTRPQPPLVIAPVPNTPPPIPAEPSPGTIVIVDTATTLTSDQEVRARELLNQRIAEMNAAARPVPPGDPLTLSAAKPGSPDAAAPRKKRTFFDFLAIEFFGRKERDMFDTGTTPSQATAPATLAPASATAAATSAAPLTPEQEAQARELLRQKMDDVFPAAAAVPEVPPSPAIPPATAAAPLATPPAVVTPQPAITPASFETGLTPEQEAETRALRDQQQITLPPATPAAAEDPKAQERARKEAIQKQKAESKQLAREKAESNRVAKEKAEPSNLTHEQETRALDEAERARELARIEAEVEQARQRREQTPAAIASSTPPAPTPAPVAPESPGIPAPADTPLATLSPSSPPSAPSLNPETESKARELLNQQLAELNTTSVPASVAPPVAPESPGISAPALPAPATVSPGPPPSVPSLDAETELKARELLNQQLAELNTASVPASVAPPVATPAPAPAPVLPPRQTMPDASATPPPPPAPTAATEVRSSAPPAGSSSFIQPFPTTPATPTLTPDVEEKAYQLLNQKIAELNAGSSATTVVTPAAVIPAAPPLSVASTPPPAPAVPASIPAPDAPIDSKAAAKAQREAIKKAEAEAKARAKALEREQRAARRLPVEKESQPTEATKVETKPGDSTISPAPWTVSSGKSKTERLGELLDAYKKDLITPAEYHNSRARILAEP